MLHWFGKLPFCFTALSVLLIGCQSVQHDTVDRFDMQMAIRHFEGTAFGSEADQSWSNDITKWQQPIRWHVDTWGENPRRFVRSLVARHIGELAQISGLDIWPTDDQSEANMLIVFWPSSELPSVIKATGARASIKGADCIYYSVHSKSRAIKASLIFIRSDLSRAAVVSCLVIETTQAMGLTRDGGIVRGSVAMEGHLTIDRLAEIDRLMLRTLYDPRLKPGMTKEEAMPIARQIIRELWPSVRQPG